MLLGMPIYQLQVKMLFHATTKKATTKYLTLQNLLGTWMEDIYLHLPTLG